MRNEDTVGLLRPDELELPYLASPLESKELMAIEKRRIEAKERVHGVSDEDLKVISGMYKVEVHMHHERSMNRPFVGRIFTMVKARQFGGGGDMPMFACANDRCPGFVHPDNYSTTKGIAVCPVCQVPWSTEALDDYRDYVLTHQHWATAITRTFLRMGQDADIVLKYFSGDLIEPTMKSKEQKRLGHDLIRKSRSLRRKVVYPLGNILKDLSVGAGLEKRVYVFITA